MSSFPSMNKYWIPHLDIHKKVITQELQYYLGPEATVRSFTRDVGLLITTPGPCLTDVSRRPRDRTPSIPGHEIDTSQEQIDDICVKSKEMWEKQAAARASGSSSRILKRPLHQPVVIAKAGASDSTRRRRESRRSNESRSRRDERRRTGS